ncbi:MAG TPA: SpoIIE family protein phosphatase [Magnetospirillum sp.]|jgi:sigma-B regulation protein RsbU (phosphoserine phosphatase)|nr:SpoIIE family protein phosphatase [Magnetospirillum sp.]
MNSSSAILPAGVADDLELIAEMTADFARSRDIEESLRVGLQHIASRMEADAASLFLMDEGELVCRACFGPADVTGLRLPHGQGIVWRAVMRNRPQLVRDVATDPDFAHMVDQVTGFSTRSILCAPMSVRDECVGAIELFNKKGGQSFDDDDRRILQALAASAALALINARHAAAMAEQEAFRRELALAADIQRAMLPAAKPADFPIHGVNLPARGVSGDFFDVVELADGRLAFAIADVSGKGMNAALLMAKTASLFRCLAKRLDGPGALLAAIDAELAETGSAGMFVTMVAGVLDPATGQVVLANAGHEPPLMWREGAVERVEGGMPPLGIDPTLFLGGCPESRIDLRGGALYLFTDGLTEARLNGGMLGSEGVEDLLARHHDLPAPERLEAVIADVAQDGLALRDDLTMLVVEGRPMSSNALDRLFPARPERLCDIRHAVAETASRLGCPEPLVNDVVLAVDEACQNIIRHAYGGTGGDIVVQLGREDQRLVVRLIDFAAPVDRAKICSRALDDIRPGGLGTHLMRSIMDEVAFVPPPPGAGNMLQMVKRIGEP